MAVSRAAASRMAITRISVGIRSRYVSPLPTELSLNTLPRAVAMAICADGSVGNCCRRGIEQNFVDRRQLAKQPEESDKLRGRCRPHGSIQELRLKFAGPRQKLCLLAAGDAAKHLRGHLPGTRSRPGVGVRGRIRRVQKFRLEAQEGDDLGTDLSLDRPPAPVVEIRFKVQMHETVAQRSRHREVNAAFRGRIAGGDDDPAIGQHILAELSVEHQLIATRLGHLRRRGQLIEEEDALAGRREKLRGHPFCLVCRDARQAAQIDRIELHGPHVEKVVVEIVGDLGDDL